MIYRVRKCTINNDGRVTEGTRTTIIPWPMVLRIGVPGYRGNQARSLTGQYGREVFSETHSQHSERQPVRIRLCPPGAYAVRLAKMGSPKSLADSRQRPPAGVEPYPAVIRDSSSVGRAPRQEVRRRFESGLSRHIPKYRRRK